MDYAICEVEKVLSTEIYNDKEVAYMKSLMCTAVGKECEIRSDLLQSIFLSISLWCDSKLQDYHLHFDQVFFYNLPLPIICFLILQCWNKYKCSALIFTVLTDCQFSEIIFL